MRVGFESFVENLARPQPIQPIDLRIGGAADEESEQTPFSEILQITMTGRNDMGAELSAISREGTVQALLGQTEDLAAAVVASQKSGLQFELNLNIRNKVLDAYNEIMRMQV